MNAQDLNILLTQAFQRVQSLTNMVSNSLVNSEWHQLRQVSSKFRANEDASIYQHLHHAFDGVLGQSGFRRIEDSQGHKVTLARDNLELEVTVTHRATGIEDVHGVDLMYEVAGWKSMAFQHKKRNEVGRFDFSKKEHLQRKKIVRLCGACKVPGLPVQEL